MSGDEAGRADGPWFENDEFWQSAAASLFGDDAWDAAASDAPDVLSLLDLPAASHILDLGCGPGRYALPLAAAGCRVTGVDRTSAFLEEARSRARSKGLDVELVESDMRTFRRASAFDGAISMLTSFGYFEDPGDDIVVLENVLDSLKPGGILLIDTIGKEILGRIFQARDWKRVGDEYWLFERRPVRAWSWMENSWIRIRDGVVREFEIGHRLYSAVELANLAQAAGFSETAAYGSLKAAPYDEKADRLVVLARKAS